MTIRAWRIVKSHHAATAFSGDGARKFGGRWNSPGVPMIYTAGNMSLMILEMLVHLESAEMLKRYSAFEVSFEEKLVTTVDLLGLPKTWRKSPPSEGIQRIGDRWIAGGRSSVLRVPSAIVPAEWNYLLNPKHADFAKVAIGRKKGVQFDPRLIKPPGK